MIEVLGVRSKKYRKNPLLAVVGNPGGAVAGLKLSGGFTLFESPGDYWTARIRWNENGTPWELFISEPSNRFLVEKAGAGVVFGNIKRRLLADWDFIQEKPGKVESKVKKAFKAYQANAGVVGALRETHVANPYRKVHPLAYEARDRYLEDREAGHDDAAEYWRGQAGAFFTGNPEEPHPYGRYWRSCRCGRDFEVWSDDAPSICEECWWYLDQDERLLEEKKAKKATRKKTTRKKTTRKKAKKKTTRKKAKKANPQDKKKARPRVQRVSIEEARKKGVEGIEEAIERYVKFHGAQPRHVDIYHLPDGKSELRMEHAHVALHRTLETPYVVPWKSNKKGSLWLHEHPKGEGAPLEVLDPETGTTRKIGGDYVVDEWWYS